jgi:DNA-binding response OmpR family regulator
MPSLPTNAPSSAAAVRPIAGDGVSPHGARAEPRILVVDDDRDAVLTLMMLLKDEGYAPHGVYSGRYVMASVIDIDPDVVLLDIHLPDRSGWEVARAIRSQRGKARPMIVGVSGEHTRGSDRLLSRMLGFDHYLLKPYALADLLALLAPLRIRN